MRTSSQWYYGDTHYHSSYTSDLKEFGNPIPDTREAARCIGLEWLILTDHSVDLQDNNSTTIPELAGRSVQEQNALAFAAHPTYDAQGRYGYWETEDLDQPELGMEVWNTRQRKHARAEENPFDKWQANNTGRSNEDAAIARWDDMLHRRIDRDDPRFVLLAGSDDAHGSFNYSISMALELDLKHVDLNRAEDNCLCKVRTLLYLPHRVSTGDTKAPGVSEIIAAIRQGSCVVTDGPVLNLTAHFNGREAKLGEMMAGLSGDGSLELKIQACSTAEFGEIKQVKVVFYFKGMSNSEAASGDFYIGNSRIINENLPATSGYIRLEAETHNGNESFRCVTNPIWLRFSDSGKRSLKVTCAAW